MREVRLVGLDGSNLLAFLAALGALRTLALTAGGAGARMGWIYQRGWVPEIVCPTVEAEDDVLSVLEGAVCGAASVSDAWNLGEDLTLGLEDFRKYLWRSAASCTPKDRASADFLAAFGSDGVGAGPKKDRMTDTEFRTMSGAGHQHFVGFMKELAVGTTKEHLRRTLFVKWDYADGRPSMRWDPADYRPHALRAYDPSGDPIRTMRGANRLAVEALPLFATAPNGRRLGTSGFQDRDGDAEFTWPMWTEFLELRTVQSLVGLKELQVDRPEAFGLRRRCVEQVFRSTRFTDGKYRNFSPARALL